MMAADVPTLRVATLNIWHDRGPWPDRLRLIRQEIRRLEPAVVALQEVLRHPSADRGEVPATPDSCQATAIADDLGYAVAYGAAADHSSRRAGGVWRFGNAVLSRRPIRRHHLYPLPGAESGETRSLLFVLVDTPDGDLPVFATHLNWRLHHGVVRLAQVRFIADRVAELAPPGDATLPAVLMGDLNAEPDSDEIRFLRGLHVVDGRSVYFADAWIHGGDGSAGSTWDRRNDYARLGPEPTRRIDYILAQGPDAAGRGQAVRTELAFTTPERCDGELVWPSDHFGIVSDLAV